MAGITDVFVICPCFKTGGPEALHQLAFSSSEVGFNAVLVYTGDCTNLYVDDYPSLKIGKMADIIDSSKSAIIIPEVFDPIHYRNTYPKSKIIVWWLSYNHGRSQIPKFRGINAVLSPVAHAFQSYYAEDMVRKDLQLKTTYFLFDFTRSSYVNFIPPKDQKKLPVVLYNPAKDKVTPRVASQLNITSVALTGMNLSALIENGSRSSVYVDYGSHPGKDRFPREMAMLGCVIVTNQEGSARYYEDVPIDEKVVTEAELSELLTSILKDPTSYYIKQQSYRDIIKNEKHEFKEQIKKLFISL